MTTFADDFLRDVARHEMIVIRDDGLSRHIRFKRPDTMCMHFDLLTWRGYLCYTGDMGTFVFRRLDDMLIFFRRPPDYPAFRIDMRYWAEKVEAADKCDGISKFSADLFRENLRDRFDESYDETPEAEKALIWAKVQRSVMYDLDDNLEQIAFRAAMDFEHDGQRPFAEFYERRCQEYTERFKWCCHALEWAIGVYDASKPVPAFQTEQTQT